MPSRAAEPSLQVRDLRTWFLTDSGPVRAVDGVSFDVACRRDARHRRRIRLGQERLRHVDHAPARRAGADRRRRDRCSRAATSRIWTTRRLRARARPRDRHGVPGPDDLAQPGPAHRATARRGDDGARPLQPAAARSRAVELLRRMGGHPAPERARERVPASVLRRHAPARDARDGLRQRACAAHRRRADHRARRDDPGADPRPAARAATATSAPPSS